MKLMLGPKWGWYLVGIVGKNANWFFGFSRKAVELSDKTAEERHARIMGAVERYATRARDYGDLSNLAQQAKLELEIILRETP